ncbi:MAG: heme o synthase, partial [Alphaproteobacteria bacterium]
TAIIGAALAPGEIHPFLFAVSILCIAVGAGASGALNMWYDRDIDAVMQRTKDRPIPAGAVRYQDALGLGITLSVASVITLGLATNYVAAGILAFTIFFYAVIYTMILKRRTPQNIVIGGAAGAFPPMIGWAAVTGDVTAESMLLFAIIFLWTPPHFWALALYRCQDYVNARVPMLPVVSGEEETKTQILIYSIVLAITVSLPYFIGMAGMPYLILATVLNVLFIAMALRLKRLGGESLAKKLFGFSILYLFLVFLGLFVDHLL